MEAYKNFLDDQRAIASGLAISEVQAGISGAEAQARRATREEQAMARAARSFEAFDFNLLK
jgi:hypothetical protein